MTETKPSEERAIGSVTTIIPHERLRVRAYDMLTEEDKLFFDDPFVEDSWLGMQESLDLHKWR